MRVQASKLRSTMRGPKIKKQGWARSRSERLAVKDEELPRVLAHGPRGGLLLPLLGAELVDGWRADSRVLEGVLSTGRAARSALRPGSKLDRRGRTLAVRSSEYIS